MENAIEIVVRRYYAFLGLSNIRFSPRHANSHRVIDSRLHRYPQPDEFPVIIRWIFG
uniref:Uncharacterized protein n=1 Tax=Candidatus Kentrum sp. FW TaxID=2126338 RepID=A0A450TUK1_9GAMM|nr:MAG: hypothetical protein BECKFW1821C_GA0114237_10363 [Candidatus Kentron sp. FW]